jgi:peroxiredoxin
MEAFMMINLIALWSALALITWMMLKTTSVLKGVGLLGMAEQTQEQSDVQPIVIGDDAPTFSAHTLAGEQVALADYAGRPVAFIFMSTSCPYCKDALPHLQKIAPLAKKKSGVEIVPVIAADLLETKAFVEQQNVMLPVLVAPPSVNAFFNQYNPDGGVPAYVFVDEHGKIASMGHPSDTTWQKLERQWLPPQVFRKEAAEYL